MKKQLIEVTKGSVKGLVGTVVSTLTLGMGMPVVDQIYKSINSKAGRIAYGVSSGVLLTSAVVAYHSIGN